MRAWSTTGDDGAVRVQGPDGEILGSGFLVDQRRVLTCAHVVEGLDEAGVVFLAEPAAGARAAKVTSRAYDGKGQDLAVLELVEEPPEAARPLRLEAASAGGRFRALGFPAGHDHGLWIRGATAGPNLLGWVQIEPDGARDVARGFSGGATWSDEGQAAVGMVVARSGERVAWMIPVGLLHETFPEVAIASAPPRTEEKRPFRSMATPPEQYVDRVEYARVLAALTGTGGTTVALTTALRGAGGYGKTTLAQALCADPAVRTAYPAGILWTTMGENLRPADHLARLRDLLRFWNEEEPPVFETATAAGAALRQALVGHRVLLVVDDVWDPADLTPLHGLGGKAALLVTTRDRRNVPRDAVPFDIDEMRRDEAVALLAASLPPAEVEEHRDPLRALAHRLGKWPLLLSLVNRQLVDLVRDGLEVGAAIAEVNRSLDAHGLEAFDRDDTEARQEAVSRTLAVSLDRLTEVERAHFFALAVFSENADVPLTVVAPLWGLSPAETTRHCARLHYLSLLRELDRTAGTLRLHVVIRAYLLAHSPSPQPELHRLLLAALRPASGRWNDLPLEPLYPWRNLAEHLVAAGSIDELHELLFDLGWLETKLRRIGVNALLADCMRLIAEPEVAQLLGTLRLSAHVLGRDPEQLAGQLLSRMAAAGDRWRSLIDACATRGGLLHLIPGSIGPRDPLVRTFDGHTGSVQAVAVLDERHVVSGSFDGTMRLWDLDTGESLRTFEGYAGWVAVAALDERRFVSASDEGTLHLWDVETGDCLCSLETHTVWISALAVIDEQRVVVSGSRDRTVRLWNIFTGESPRILEGHESWVTALAVLDDQRIISASGDGTLRLWDLNSGECLRIFKGHTDEVRAVAVHEKRGVSGSSDRTLRLWNLETGECVHTLEAQMGGSVTAVALLDNRRVISASEDGTLRLWNPDSGECSTFKRHASRVSVLALLDECRAVSAADDGTLRLWDLKAAESLPGIERHTGWIQAVALIDERRVLSAGETLCLWDVQTGKCLRTFGKPTGWVDAVAVLDEHHAVFASHDSLCLWNLETDECASSLKHRMGAIQALAVFNEHRVISASGGTVCLWDIATGARLRTFKGHTGMVRAVALLDERRFVSASDDGTLRIWDSETGECLRTLEDQPDWIQGVAVLDKRRVITASDDRKLRLWDLDTGETLRTITGHAGAVSAVAVLDERRVVSASRDRTIRLWDVEDGRQIAILTLDAPASTLVTHPPTQTIVACDASYRLHVLRYIEPSK